MLMTKAGKFINLVATVDRVNGSGEILYVNPSTVASVEDTAAEGAGPPAAAMPFDDFAVSIQDGDGHELHRFRPTIQVDHCATGSVPDTGFVNEDIPVLDGMKRLVLLYKGNEVSQFMAGELPGQGAGAAGGAPVAMEAAASADAHRMSMRAETMPAPEPGISYTVQVLPEGMKAWQTIAVGRPTPEAEIDRNQFPGAKAATLRVLRSTGFEDEVFSEQKIDFDY